MGMTMLGERISAEQAEAWGLIWKTYDDDRLMSEASAIAPARAAPPRASACSSARSTLPPVIRSTRSSTSSATCSASSASPSTTARRSPNSCRSRSLFPRSSRRCSTGELKKLQLERLQWSLAHAYNNVPRYREKFAAAGIKPADCRALEDLARFPFTTKADLRETYPFGMFAVPMDLIVRIR